MIKCLSQNNNNHDDDDYYYDDDAAGGGGKYVYSKIDTYIYIIQFSTIGH